MASQVNILHKSMSTLNTTQFMVYGFVIAGFNLPPFGVMVLLWMRFFLWVWVVPCIEEGRD